MRFTQAATLHTGTSADPRAHALDLREARSTWSRFRGLMLSPPLRSQPHPQALLITRCPSVHGFFMRQVVDVLYLAREHEDCYTVRHMARLAPWRVSVGRNGGVHALEMPAGSIERLGIAVGNVLRLHR